MLIRRCSSVLEITLGHYIEKSMLINKHQSYLHFNAVLPKFAHTFGVVFPSKQHKFQWIKLHKMH